MPILWVVLLPFMYSINILNFFITHLDCLQLSVAFPIPALYLIAIKEFSLWIILCSVCVAALLYVLEKEYTLRFLPLKDIIWRRQWHLTPVHLPGKSHGRKSLVGCSPWGREELDTTERLHFHFSLFCIGEGNGNPLQCSCLENPRDGGAWCAAVSGVAQSRTQLKWLSIAKT